MSVDPKTAKHICSVTRRQVERTFPEFSIHFITHHEFGREKAYSKSIRKLSQDKVGQHIVDHYMEEEHSDVLRKNRSYCALLGFHRTHGFLGFKREEKYLALVFVNHDRFRTEDDLRRHVFHLSWHAINLYKVAKREQIDQEDAKGYKIVGKIVLPSAEKSVLYESNMQADIFSSCLQALQGRENALNMMFKQRMRDTIQKDAGFFAEDFAFPICSETMDFVFKSHIAENKRNKQPIISALKIANDLGRTYDANAIQHWRSFAIPAQEMAWNGHPPETVLGAAIYTAEDTYIQSIADMVAEKLQIRPEILTDFDDYNPFAHPDVNKRAHEKRCEDIISTVLTKILRQSDYPLIIEIAEKQNQALLTGSALGWCVPALIEAAERLKHMDSAADLTQELESVHKQFSENIKNFSWDTLSFLSHIIVQYRRQRTEHRLDELLWEIEQHAELESIYYAIYKMRDLTQKKPTIKAGF